MPTMLRALPHGIVGIVLVLAAAMAFTGRVREEMRDFEVYWTAGGRAAAGEPLYRASDGHYRFKYLPAFAVAVSPLARLPLNVAKAVWFTLSLGCLVALVALSIQSVPRPGVSRGWLAALTIVTMAKFYGHDLVLGQANLLFAAICMSGLAALLAGRTLGGGMCLGGAALIKPYAVVFVPYLLLTRQWTAALAACGALVCVLALPAALFGTAQAFDQLSSWWSAASETSVPLLTNADSSSVFAMYAKWFDWGSLAAACSSVTVAALGCAFLLVIWKRRRVETPAVLETALLLTFIPLCTPQGWDYVLLLSTPLVALLIARVPAMPRADRWIAVAMLSLVAFSLYDVMGRAAYRAFMALSVITVCYLVLTVVAVRLRLRGAA